MPRKVPPLTDTQLRQAKPRDKEYNLQDGDGLLLRVKPNGTKTWLLNYYRPHNGKRANMTLGTYPTTSLAAARTLRLKYRAYLEQGSDPIMQREEEQRAKADANTNTLEKVAKQWFDIKKARTTPAHAQDIWRSLEKHVFPDLGKLPLHMIRAKRVIEVLQPLSAKGTKETLKRVSQRLNEVMVHAVHMDLIDANPLTHIQQAFNPPDKKHLPTIKPEELPELMESINGASIKLTTRCLIEWQLHTLVRPYEAAATRWVEIDMEKAIWTIPAERMKKRRPHTVPLTPQAMTLLQLMRPISGHREHVFPSEKSPRTHIHRQTANMALKRMGYGNRLVAHGLRALASTTLNEQGFDPDVIEAALAHTDKNEVRAAYNRAEYLERRRKMMEWWSKRIQQAAEGNLSLSGKKHLQTIS